jgi:hypothetical protein
MGSKKVAALALLLLVAACTTTGGTFCDVARPIRLSDKAIAAMSDQEVGEALAHDRKGQRLCGWKP